MVNVAIIGDVHYHFSEADLACFNDATYDLILLVGDLSDFHPRRGYQVARTIAGLQKPALMIPGNHDTVNLFQLLAEIKRVDALARLFGLGQIRREAHLRQCLGPVTLGGYGRHAFSFSGQSFDVVTARPYSMGGPGLSFKPYLKQRFGIDTLAASTRLLKQRVDEAASDQIIFLAHNGPHGCGSRRNDIWGCDFKVEEGDFGDWDLWMAIKYARAIGRRVIAVVAGHMHHQLRGGGHRRWHLARQGIHYLNAAHVPRLFVQDGRHLSHHIRLSFDAYRVEVEERLVEHK